MRVPRFFHCLEPSGSRLDLSSAKSLSCHPLAVLSEFLLAQQSQVLQGSKVPSGRFSCWKQEFNIRILNALSRSVLRLTVEV